MKDVGLVCEGGGLRGIYTAGVLDYFLDIGLEFPYLVGVSAGAIYPASYISRQKGRTLEIQRRYIKDPRYMSFKNLIKTGNLFDPEFAYYRMTKELVPFDYAAFKTSKTIYKIGTFNCLTGSTHYYSKEDFTHVDEAVTALLASGSIPFLSKEVVIDGVPYLDGGIASPIPLHQSITDGNKKHFIILTQPGSYKKYPLKYRRFTEIFYRRYPHVAKALINRHNIYNDTLEDIKTLKNKGEAYIIKPSRTIGVGRLERNVSKIEELYRLGYEDAKREYSDIIKWLNP